MRVNSLGFGEGSKRLGIHPRRNFLLNFLKYTHSKEGKVCSRRMVYVLLKEK